MYFIKNAMSLICKVSTSIMLLGFFVRLLENPWTLSTTTVVIVYFKVCNVTLPKIICLNDHDKTELNYKDEMIFLQQNSN